MHHNLWFFDHVYRRKEDTVGRRPHVRVLILMVGFCECASHNPSSRFGPAKPTLFAKLQIKKPTEV